MIQRHALAEYLHRVLNCADFKDYAPNGLQIEGRTTIRRICTAVTASLESIEQAIAFQADALLVHHGYFWRGEEPTITGLKRARVAKLVQHELSLFAYHLPLDCHETFGNNILLANLLHLQNMRSYQVAGIPNLLWSGTLATSQCPIEFSDFLQEKLNRKPIMITGSSQPVCNIAWCSGAAQDYIEQAHALGVDTYLSGEISERTYYQAKELGIHYFACGHHATERGGIQALGQHLAENFGIDHQFLDSENPV